MTKDRRLVIALAINIVVVAAQVVAGFVAGSLGLLADAGHNVTDVTAVVLSLVAVRWARRPPNETKTFGYHRAGIVAAQANAALLMGVTIVIAVEAIHRLADPHPVDGTVMAVVGGIAFAGNLVAAGVLHDHGDDLNMRSAWLHMVGDAAASFGVAVSGLVIAVTGRYEALDPIVSLLIGLLIVIGAVRLVRETTDILLESTPRGLDADALLGAMRAVDGVEDVHDLHVWGLDNATRVLSAHVLVEGHPTLEEAQSVGMAVKRATVPFGIVHATLELECEGCVDDGSWCAMDHHDHDHARH